MIFLLIGFIIIPMSKLGNVENILNATIADYKKLYPDLTFSFQNVKNDIGLNYKVDLEGIVFSQGVNPIVKIDHAHIKTSFWNLFKEEGLIEIELGEVETLSAKHIFLEREFNLLFERFSAKYDAIFSWKKWLHTSKESEMILSSGSFHLMKTETQEKSANLRTYFLYSGELSFAGLIDSRFNISEWFKSGELHGANDIKLNSFSVKNIQTEKEFNQSLYIDSVLYRSGDVKWSGKGEGDLLVGEFSGKINNKSIEFTNNQFRLKLNPLQKRASEFRLQGEADVTGHWSYSLVDKKFDSTLEMKSKEVVALYKEENKEEKNPLSFQLFVEDRFNYTAYTVLGGVDVDIKGQLDLGLRNSQEELILTGREDRSFDPIFWRKFAISQAERKNFLTSVEFSKLRVKDQILNGNISWSHDHELGIAWRGNIIQDSQHSMTLKRVKTEAENICELSFNQFSIENISWIFSGALSRSSGVVSGGVTCDNKDLISAHLKSNELYLPIFAINEALKNQNPKTIIYKDDRFSLFKGTWDNGELSQIELKNRIYNISGKKIQDYFQLNLLGEKLNYQLKGSDWQYMGAQND